MKRFLTLLLVLFVVLGTTAVIGFAADTVSLSGDKTSLVVTEDTTLNLNGYCVGELTVEPGVTVTLTGVDTGTVGQINGGGIVRLAENYMQFEDGQLTLKTAGATLRTDPTDVENNGASIFYTSTFGGNEKVKEKIVAYGVALGAGRVPNFEEKTFTRNMDLTKWVSGEDETFDDNGVLLKGIMKSGKAYSMNKLGANMRIYNVAYVELEDGTRITSNPLDRSLKDMVQTLTTGEKNPVLNQVLWDTLNYTQKTNMVSFYERFSAVMSAWDLGRMEPLVKVATDKIYYINNADDAKLMPLVTGADIQLQSSVDFDGAAIAGLANFTGSFYGNGNTISNVTINGAGFVDTVAAGEAIKDLHLRDVHVNAPATATAAGTIAGTNHGTITGVTATGTVTSSCDNAFVGALVGKSTGTVIPGANITDVISGKQLRTDQQVYGLSKEDTYHTTANLAASVGLYAEGNNVTTGLVASGSVENPQSVYWRDNSYSTKRQTLDLQQKRATVVAEMFNSGTYRWTPAQTFTHSAKSSVHTKTYKSGTSYVGTPYDHRSTPYSMAMDFATWDGSTSRYTIDLTGYVSDWSNSFEGTEGTTYPYDGYTRFISSDCSSACIVGWHQVSPVLLNAKSNNGASPTYTYTMVPSQVNQWYYGIRPVGYTIDDATMNGGIQVKKDADGNPVKDEQGNEIPVYYDEEYVGKTMYQFYGEYQDTPVYKVTTDAIAQKLGAKQVYEAYAQTRMGDVLLSGGFDATSGHARMVAQDPVVIRNGANEIDPDKSFFLTHEQGDGLYDYDKTHSSWRINYKYTFRQLAFLELTDAEKTAMRGTQSYGYYLPITMDALQKEVGLHTVSASASHAKGPADVAINSMSRILSARLIIKDSAGKEVYTETFYKSAINEVFGSTSVVSNYRNAPGAAVFYTKYFTNMQTLAQKANLTSGETYTYDYAIRTFKDLDKDIYLSSVLKQGTTNADGEITADYTFIAP